MALRPIDLCRTGYTGAKLVTDAPYGFYSYWFSHSLASIHFLESLRGLVILYPSAHLHCLTFSFSTSQSFEPIRIMTNDYFEIITTLFYVDFRLLLRGPYRGPYRDLIGDLTFNFRISAGKQCNHKSFRNILETGCWQTVFTSIGNNALNPWTIFFNNSQLLEKISNQFISWNRFIAKGQ